jgi:hypothetical protein
LADHPSGHTKKYLMGFFMFSELDANGVICRVIFRHGEQYMNIFADGRNRD